MKTEEELIWESYQNKLLVEMYSNISYPKGVKKYIKTANKGTNTAWLFTEFKFTTSKGNIVKVQFIPVSDGIELSFTVNDSFEDLASGGFDREILSGVLGIVKKQVDKNDWDNIEITPKKGDKDYKILKSYNYEESKNILLNVIKEIEQFKEKENLPRWLNHLTNNVDKLISGEFDLSKVASGLYMNRDDVKNNKQGLKLLEDFTKALTDYDTALQTKREGGRKVEDNRRARVFVPILQKILTDYELKDGSFNRIIFSKVT